METCRDTVVMDTIDNDVEEERVNDHSTNVMDTIDNDVKEDGESVVSETIDNGESQ